MLTLRFLLILLAPLALITLGGSFALAGVTLLVLALLAAAVDWFLARDIARISVDRQLDSDKLSLAAWNPVRLSLTNATARPQRLLIRDVVPLDFDLDTQLPLFQARLRPHEQQTLMYHVRPRERGDAQFGDLFVRAEGPFGLVRRSRRLRDTARPVRVYPNLRDLKRYDLLVRRGLESQPGTRTIRRPGASAEFERVREYLPDDEFRRMNWKATARRGHPMVNQFETERSQNLVMLLDAGRAMAALAEAPDSGAGAPGSARSPQRAGPSDASASPSVRFGRPDAAASPLAAFGGASASPAAVIADESDLPPGLTKLDYALNTALLLAHVGSLRGDRVALLAYADDIRTFVPPQRGRRALLATVQALYSLRAEPVEPDHGRALDFLARRNLRRSLVVCFTDLIDRESSSALASHLIRAARHHLVVCVTLGDPNVRRPAERTPSDAATLYEKMVAQHLLDDRAALIRNLNAYGVLTIDTDADHLSPQVIGTYLDLKHRGRI